MFRAPHMVFLISLLLSLTKTMALMLLQLQGECEKVYDSGVNSSDQDVIVDTHNQLRLALARGDVAGQPQACNLKKMHYDTQLAAVAQQIADTCRFEHVTVDDPRWSWVGHNIYMSMSTALSKGANWNAAIQSWFNEHVDYHYPDDSKSNTGHYTQVAWANTSYVGCGYTSYDDTSDRFRYQKLYVCNYGPGGNIRGNAPYKIPKNGQCGCSNLC